MIRSNINLEKALKRLEKKQSPIPKHVVDKMSKMDKTDFESEMHNKYEEVENGIRC